MPFYRRVTCGIAFCLGFCHGFIGANRRPLAAIAIAWALYKLGLLAAIAIAWALYELG